MLANLGVKLAGLAPILGGSVGAALGIAVNPVVALGASAESTPTAPVTTPPAERARKLANNTLPAGEMTAEEREAFSKAHGGGLWDALKRRMGFGGGADETKVKADIATTAEATEKLADKVDGPGVGFGGVTASTGGTGGTGGSGHHADGGTSPGASLRDRGADHRTFWQRHAPRRSAARMRRDTCGSVARTVGPM